MPVLVPPALPAGHLAANPQPHLTVDGGLTLRPWLASDAEAVRSAFDCPDIQKWHVRRLDDLDEARAWIADWPAYWASEKAVSWAIVNDRDEPIGQTGLRNISLSEANAAVSYWIAPAARGRGVALRALHALTRWSFELGMHRLSLQHSTGNLASCRVATKARFALEGTHRGSMLHADGWHDSHAHAKLRTDDAA
ncbi:GNAT family N-acetyltransferase [Longispora sp. K20-0274]|uniref:GNAT family N-acetyltransferase n=1 Tax=Longispora sp. K20-0274 TaxID=3088255 RepID=UPI00399B2FE7